MRRLAAVAVVLAVAAPALHAQAPSPVASAAQGAPEVKKILSNVANALGMLRGVGEEDSVMSVEFWGSGTMVDGGREYKVTKYHGALGYDFPGMRVEIERTAGGAAPQRDIRVVSGTQAWNEDKPGAGLVTGFGNAVPATDAVNERLLQLWMMPFGAYKAAVAAGANVKVAAEGGRTVLNFPLTEAGVTGPAANVVVGALKGSPVKVTLNAQNRPETVEIRYGGRVYETTYSDYGDLNEKDNKADIFFPARIVLSVDGKPVLTLAIDRTNTYNPYVIMPVPESIQKVGSGQSAVGSRQ
jgi:hypothetical protein